MEGKSLVNCHLLAGQQWFRAVEPQGAVGEIVLLPFVLLSLIASEQIPVLTPLDTASVVCPVLPLDDLGTNISAPGFVMTHMAIDGAGWFVVSDPSGTRFVTRRGDFRLDSNNNLITARGYRVQGFTDLDLTTVGDVQIDSAVHPNFVDPAAAMTTFSVQANGVVHVAMSDGTKFTRAQILLQQISRPENIQRIYPDVFLAEADADPAPTMQEPGSAGLGMLISGTLSSEKLLPLRCLLPSFGKPKISDEGIATMTGPYTDLAIRVPGAFVVRDPATSELFATRAGMFLLDRDGFLITYDHKRLQGHNSFTPHGVIGDIQIGLNTRATTAPDAVIIFASFEANGDVINQYSDGTSSLEAKIPLYNFRRPDLLTPVRLGQFSGVMAAQPYAVEGVGQFGRGTTRIEQGQLELVNVSRDLLRLRRQLSFFPQDALYRTTSLTDHAIDGLGFFLLKHPLTGEKFVTRRGDFHLDASGYLVNEQSMRVQGIPDVALNEIGDVRIAGRFAIYRDGSINVYYPDGSQTNEGFVLLQLFKESYQLSPAGHGLYQNLEAAAPVGLVFAGTYGAGGCRVVCIGIVTRTRIAFFTRTTWNSNAHHGRTGKSLDHPTKRRGFKMENHRRDKQLTFRS